MHQNRLVYMALQTGHVQPFRTEAKLNRIHRIQKSLNWKIEWIFVADACTMNILIVPSYKQFHETFTFMVKYKQNVYVK